MRRLTITQQCIVHQIVLVLSVSKLLIVTHISACWYLEFGYEITKTPDFPRLAAGNLATLSNVCGLPLPEQSSVQWSMVWWCDMSDVYVMVLST